MKRNFTELLFLLDKSGSMSGLEQDTIGGFNAMLEKQKDEPGSAYVTTVLFNQKAEIIHDRVPLSCLSPMTRKDYQVGGMTALLDVIGMTIERMNRIQLEESEDSRARKVIFVITTDGYDNSSREFTYPAIKRLIQKQENEMNWEFLFLGANMDAVKEAGKIGIRPDHSTSFHNDRIGIHTSCNSVGKAVSSMRTAETGKRLDGSWKEEIESDFRTRSLFPN